MNRFAITVLGATPAAQTAAPGIAFCLRVENIAGGLVQAALLRCHIRIEPTGRAYSDAERARLYELFGDQSQWARNLHPVTWGHAAFALPSFEKLVDMEVVVPCTYDMEVGASKYLHAVRDGQIAVQFLFGGTVFVRGKAGLQIEPVSWDTEASYRMPAAIWHEAMAQFFPGGGWLRVSQETIDRLQAFRGRQAAVTWDDALDTLLKSAAKEQIA
jgi:hypothetical protein